MLDNQFLLCCTLECFLQCITESFSCKKVLRFLDWVGKFQMVLLTDSCLICLTFGHLHEDGFRFSKNSSVMHSSGEQTTKSIVVDHNI